MPAAALACLALLALAAPACLRAQISATATPADVVQLPARLDAGRFYARPVTTGGDTLELFTDTGGGLFLTQAAVAQLGLPRVFKSVERGDSLFVVKLPAFAPGLGVPAPLGNEGELMVLPDTPGRVAPRSFSRWSGMLGTPWFAGRVWTFDYPGRRLLLRPAGDVPALDARYVAPLHFRQDSAGQREGDFPRIRVVVDGDTLDMLFDTGATVVMPDSALAILGDGGPSERATSFITTEVFTRWRARHPDWRVIPGADQVPGMAMIEVPSVEVGGRTVGPVWFTQRPDQSFHRFMAQFMDQPVDGAIGGSAFGTLRITLDYPDAKAYFEQP